MLERQDEQQHHERTGGDAEVETVEEWLERDSSHDASSPQLTLKMPPPKQRKIPVFQPVDVSSSSENDDDDDGSCDGSSDTESGGVDSGDEDDKQSLNGSEQGGS